MKTKQTTDKNILDYFIAEHNMEFVCDKGSCQLMKAESELFDEIKIIKY